MSAPNTRQVDGSFWSQNPDFCRLPPPSPMSAKRSNYLQLACQPVARPPHSFRIAFRTSRRSASATFASVSVWEAKHRLLSIRSLRTVREAAGC